MTASSPRRGLAKGASQPPMGPIPELRDPYHPDSPIDSAAARDMGSSTLTNASPVTLWPSKNLEGTTMKHSSLLYNMALATLMAKTAAGPLALGAAGVGTLAAGGWGGGLLSHMGATGGERPTATLGPRFGGLAGQTLGATPRTDKNFATGEAATGALNGFYLGLPRALTDINGPIGHLEDPEQQRQLEALKVGR